MNTRDIRVTDVTHRAATRTMIEPDQRAIDILMERSQIPPLDGAVPEPTDYYSLGSQPNYLPHQRREWMRALTIGLTFIVCSVAVWALATGSFVALRAIYRAVFS